jgi:hypothetical protein
LDQLGESLLTAQEEYSKTKQLDDALKGYQDRARAAFAEDRKSAAALLRAGKPG